MSKYVVAKVATTDVDTGEVIDEFYKVYERSKEMWTTTWTCETEEEARSLAKKLKAEE